MAGSEATETILKDLRARLVDWLSHAPARERFREKVAAWCKRVAESGQPGAAPVDAGMATPFGSVGSLAMITALMRRGPQDLDEAHVLLAAIHDSGPHIGRTGQASPVEWDTEAQSVSGEDDPLILDWAAHGEWHLVVSQLDALTPEAVGRLPAWIERVEGDIKAMETDVSSKGGASSDGPLARIFASILESKRLSDGGYDVHAADDDWETCMKQVSAEVEDTARHALQVLEAELLPRSDGKMFLPPSFAVQALEPCLKIVVRCRLEHMDIEPDTANFGIRLADALDCRKWDFTIPPTSESDHRAIAEAIALAYMQAKEPPVIDWANVRAVLERWTKNVAKGSARQGADASQRPVCAGGTDGPSSCGLAANESVNGSGEKGEQAERPHLDVPSLCEAIRCAYALKEIHDTRYFYPNALDAGETAKMIAMLRASLEFALSSSGLEAFRPFYDEYRPGASDARGRITELAVGLLMCHPDAIKDPRDPSCGKQFRKALSECTDTATGKVKDIIERLTEVKLFDCRMPTPADDGSFQEQRRYLQMLRAYWQPCRTLILRQVDAPVGYQPHPLMKLLLNLRERMRSCLQRLEGLPEALAAVQAVESLLDILLKCDPDDLSVVPEWTRGEVQKVDLFIEETRLALGAKTYPMTDAERVFLNHANAQIDGYQAQVDAAWGKMCERTDGPQHADETPSNTEGNIFERKGHGWCIRLEGTELLFKDTHGFRYIAELLLKKAGIGASDLRSSIAKGVTAKYSRDVTRDFVNGDAAGNEANTGVQSGLGDESRQKMVDEEHIKEQIKSQVENIARAQRDNDPAAEEIAGKELHRLTGHLASVTGRGGMIRAIDDRAEKDRKAVSSAIEAALKTMAGTDRKLGEHFRKHLRSGRVFSYTGSAAWKVVL